jgi:nucleoside-diphosphate-sugar epimerase
LNRIQEYFRGKKLLVTGASGYLAWNLLQALSNVDCEIRPVSRKNHQTDIRELETWDSLLENIDYVFHFAAQTSVAAANADPILDQQQNILPFLRLLESCRRMKNPPFILFSGSASQYGLPTQNPVSESHPDKPVTVYCLHKCINEQYLELYSRQGWARGTCLRLSNVYGPGPKSSSADRGVLNQVMLKGLRKEPITIYGKGDQKRDYIHIYDVIQAFLFTAMNSHQVNGEHFVLASGKGTTLSEAFHLVADRVKLKTGFCPSVTHIDPPAGTSAVDSRHFVGDISKIKSLTRWEPKFSLVEGIDQTLDCFLKG